MDLSQLDLSRLDLYNRMKSSELSRRNRVDHISADWPYDTGQKEFYAEAEIYVSAWLLDKYFNRAKCYLHVAVPRGSRFVACRVQFFRSILYVRRPQKYLACVSGRFARVSCTTCLNHENLVGQVRAAFLRRPANNILAREFCLSGARELSASPATQHCIPRKSCWINARGVPT